VILQLKNLEDRSKRQLCWTESTWKKHCLDRPVLLNCLIFNVCWWLHLILHSKQGNPRR
jgi:hypothetical protein